MTQTATIVFCVEAGPMETQGVLLAESIRRWGGRFADAPILAIRPRFGPPLQRSTRAEFERLNVTYRRVKPTHDCWWYGTINKPTALAAAEGMVDTDLIIWLDTDTLMVADPEALDLAPGVDFAARPAESILGTTGEGSPNDAYWRTVCEKLGLSYDDLPWITSFPEGDRIRMYWQGGVYAYRRETALAQTHMAIYLERLKMRIASKRCGVYFYDQTSMTLAVHKLGLRWESLDMSYNFGLNKRNNEDWNRPELHAAKVIHYHDSLWPDVFPKFMGALKAHRPDVHAWLEEKGPMRNTLPLHWRVQRKALDVLRERRYKAYAETCTAV